MTGWKLVKVTDITYACPGKYYHIWFSLIKNSTHLSFLHSSRRFLWYEKKNLNCKEFWYFPDIQYVGSFCFVSIKTAVKPSKSPI